MLFLRSLDNATFTVVLKQWGTLQPTDEYDYWIGLILPSSSAPNDCWNQVTGDFILKTSMSNPDDRASVHWYGSSVVSGCYLFIARTSTALVIPNKSWSQGGQSGNIGVLVYGVKM